MAKGPGTVKATWVKGHATQEHVDRGITSDANREGNRVADTVADVGAELHGKYFMRALSATQDRFKQYVNLFQKVCHNIIES